jgi:hypothetical protein
MADILADVVAPRLKERPSAAADDAGARDERPDSEGARSVGSPDSRPPERMGMQDTLF